MECNDFLRKFDELLMHSSEIQCLQRPFLSPSVLKCFSWPYFPLRGARMQTLHPNLSASIRGGARMQTLHPSFSASIEGGGLLGFAWARPGLLMAPHNLILGLFSFLPALPGSSWPVLWLAEPSSLEPSVQHPLVALPQPCSWRAAPLPRAACHSSLLLQAL